jgi:hypothetical protein
MLRLNEAQHNNSIGGLEAGESQKAVARILNVFQNFWPDYLHSYIDRSTVL